VGIRGGDKGAEAGGNTPAPATTKAVNVFERQKDKVCILGFAPSLEKAPFTNEEFEFWGCNEMWMAPQAKKLDVLFELHDYQWIRDEKTVRKHIEWLRNNKTTPVFMQDHYDDIPASVKFPKDAIIEKYGRYFTNTISWEIALAIDLGFKAIHIYGVNMANDEEFQSQRPSCEYFIGLAKGMGIEVFIPNESDLLLCTNLYGFESGRIGAMHVRMEAFKEEQKRKAQAAQNQLNAAVAEQARASGAIGAVEYFERTFLFPNADQSERPKKG
jgi:hypothetical protein